MKSILVVDDNKMNLATARTVLSNEYRVIPVMKGQQAISYLQSRPFLESAECDLILLDINMPGMDGFEVLSAIRQMEHCRNIPVIFLTADNDAETETRCFREGAVDFIVKPFVPEVVLSRIGRALELEDLRRSLAARLEQKTREVSIIKSKSQQDALTGLWDRVYTEETVNKMLELSTRGALMMMDIDNFKSVNDSYGHAAGDELLKALADILRKLCARQDVICRLGGDEFVVFLKDVTEKAEMRKRAADIIAALRNKIDEFGFEVDTSLSIGISLAPEDAAEFTMLYNCADKALYYVKRNGKNSYHFFSDRLRDENERALEIVDIKYLQELMRRTDVGSGAYLLDLESFRHVYNFIRRCVDENNTDVSMLLFTISENGDEKAIEQLEKAIYSHLNRSDVLTRYSTRQLIVILMEAYSERCQTAADRMIDDFHKLHPDEAVQVSCSIARIDNQQKPAK